MDRFWKTVVDAWNGTNGEAVEHSATKTYQFEDMKRAVQKHDPDVVLVDCREPAENSVVKIPGSVNIPYTSHPGAFTLNDAEFEQTFGFPKPSKDKELVFFCASGMRASKQQAVAANNGYTKTSIYPGSMNDWVAHGGSNLDL